MAEAIKQNSSNIIELHYNFKGRCGWYEDIRFYRYNSDGTGIT